MKDLIKNMLAMGASISLSDKEAFVARVSGFIKDYQDDPAQAEKWARAFTQYLENRRDDYRIKRVIDDSLAGSNIPDKENIADLTKAIKDLTRALQKKGDDV